MKFLVVDPYGQTEHQTLEDGVAGAKEFLKDCTEIAPGDPPIYVVKVVAVIYPHTHDPEVIYGTR